ncbi:hypothetical protein A2870_00985 [Candidatus Curtissbacteria bacterium RIFCSPHIGHO2_01_FULL_41_11]|uniref:Sortase n=1 Tax=Candidatus Curtissbacteria bacterium RIFCSPHIGHO2_01_FULL_41_11 TaxID=1797711 RepID=A0A1F5G3K3_9BACT|nr:MAG: hypothetical protein A2870_00985 [Candidatus Curtissbacteria bacterium RIFCSPHIGHO2_01_FULL_41_11]
MPLAVYIKENTAAKVARARKKDRTFALTLLSIGIISIVFSVWPYFSWQLITLPRLTSKIKEVPIPQGQVLSGTSIPQNNIQVVTEPDGFSYFSTTYKPKEPRPDEFTITIPKLKIDKAKVKVDSTDFSKSLALFPGTAIPGDVGNSFITGHSVLPQFNDPKNYRAIFTRLSDLEVGDDIYVTVEGKTLHFTVQYSKVVDPKDLSVLSPISQNGRNLTLMTCVPPGTSTKRLVVITGLI